MSATNMVFRVGPHTYRPIITRRKLKGLDGKAIEGQACEGSRKLKISHRVLPERRESVLRHEYYHAWLFDVAAPTTEEEHAQFNAFISQQFERDYKAGGGLAALMAMQVEEEHEPEPTAAVSELEYLRRGKYPTIEGDHWEYFLLLCKKYQVDPWSDQLFPKMVPDYDTNTMRLKLIVKMDLLRNRACRSPRYGGFDAPVETLKNGKLYSVTYTAYRYNDAGERFPLTSIAKFDEYAPYAMGDFAANMPSGWLEKCAESKSLRRGFADEIGEMYSQEEMMQANNRPKTGPRAPKSEDPIDQPWQDDVPDIDAA